MNHPTTLPVWQKLQVHQRAIADQSMAHWFGEDANRFQRFSLEAVGIFLDYSKNRIDAETLALLHELASARQLAQWIQDLLTGGMVNRSEGRPALHTALRYSGPNPILANGADVMPAVRDTLARMDRVASAVRAGEYLGFSGQPVDTILHFGIGGSDLGPLMAFTALDAFVDKRLTYQFFSYQDPDYVRQALARYNPATTLIIIASKSFTTTETLVNAAVAQAWLLAAAPSPAQAAAQIFAVTAKSARAVEFGVAPTQVLPVWDWVGGRYSVWSAMSFIVAIAIGPDHFRAFLAGAEALDQHFASAELHANMPVILGLLDVWYNNFFALPARAIIPYGRKLRYFPDHLQQVYMESLGKRVDQNGQPVDCATGFVIWGGTGTNSQHSFHQLLLQGNQWSPIDFILPLDNVSLVANGLAQSQVLMLGYTENQLRADSTSDQQDDSRLAAQVILGNRPSHTLLLPEMTPYALGALLALYEHRVFVSSVIWGIDAFDQWGVERGKRIAKQILADLTAPTVMQDYDQSTTGLLTWIKKKLLKE